MNQIIVADRLYGVPEARAVAVSEGRITALLDERGIREHRKPDTRILEFEGTLLPGLTDAHSHPVMGAELSRGVNLTGVHTLAELRDALATARHEALHDGWILGWGLPHSVWEGRDPISQDIDEVTGNIPTALRMFDSHSLLANQAALSLAGIDGERVFPTGSRVVVNSQGEPTGYLLEVEAMHLLDPVLPIDSEDALLARLRDTLRAMNASGLTGAHVMDANGDSVSLLQSLDIAGELPLRLRLHPWIEPGMGEEGWEAVRREIGRSGDLWSLHGVKLFLDGTIDNGTAWLRSPDRDGASTRSTWPELDEYRAAIRFFAAHGVGTATHAIGDAAVLGSAAAIADARRQHPGARHRIEHLELTGDDVLDAVRSSGAVASMQPTHCTHFVHADGSDNWSQRVGSRAKEAWRSGSAEELGVPLALGSDWPIADFAPLPIMAAAQLRRPAGSSTPPVLPAEGMSAAAVVAGFTSGAAYALGREDQEGALEEGYLADFTILDRDPLEVGPDDLSSARVSATIVAGAVVFASGAR